MSEPGPDRERRGYQDGLGELQIFAFPRELIEELRTDLPGAMAAAGPRLAQSLRQIQSAICRISPYELMGVMSLYFLTAPAGSNPEGNRPMGIFQAHVEFLQALALRQAPRADVVGYEPFYPVGGRVLELVPDLVNNAVLLEMARAAKTKSGPDPGRGDVVLALRLHEMNVRGWAYQDQLDRLIVELFRPLEDEMRARLGWTAAAVVTWWSNIYDEINRRIEQHMALIRDALTWPVDDRWPGRIRATFGVLSGFTDAELVTLVGREEDSRTGFIVHSADRVAWTIFRFTRDDLVDLYPEAVAPTVLAKLTESWSLQPGDLVALSADELIRDNPVLRRPIMGAKDAWYFFLGATVFGHSALALLEAAIAADDELWAAYLDRRAAFLEEEATSVLREMLPGATVYPNVRWVDPATGRRYENDILILLDSHALVAECKGGRLPPKARLGKGRALREQIQELIVEPSEQGRRLAEVLLAATGSVEIEDANGDSVRIDAACLRSALTVGVTLEPFAGLLPRLSDVVEAGLTHEEIDDIALSIALPDLQVIRDILGRPSEVLHYLTRRTEIERGTFLRGEELDMLGLYLQTGFNLGPAEFDPADQLQLIGSSDAIDVYHYRRIEGLPADRPQPRRTEWWTGVMDRVETRRHERWTEVGVAMCNVSFEDQQRFEQAFLELRNDVKAGKRPPTDVVHLVNGPPQRRDHFVGSLVRSADPATRAKFYEQAARTAMAASNAQRIIEIAIVPEPQPEPYFALTVFDHGRDDEPEPNPVGADGGFEHRH